MTNLIEFKLFAPRNEAVVLIGSFSEWQDVPMERGADGYFRAHVEIADGFHHYKFRVKSNTPQRMGEWIEVNDPYVTQIDLKTQNGMIQVKEGERIIDTYLWQHDDQPLPANQDLVIYEMHIADFSGGSGDQPTKGTYKDAIAKLDHLSQLGINAIELMPVTEYAGNYRWGYLVRDFFAPESSYGSPADLKALIDACHGRGIRVLMDGIYNHTDDQCSLQLIDRNYWYYEDMHYPDDPDNHWGPELNYDNYDEQLDLKPAWQFVGDVVRFWIEEYHIDGIRFDAVRQLAHKDFLHWIAQAAKDAASPKPFYNIAEYIPEVPAITSCDQGPMDSCWHESFRYFIIPALCGESFELEKLKESLDARRQGFGTTINVINYLASHDREHPLTELGDRGIFGESAFKRAKLAVVLLMTALGIPMVWMGDEFGEFQHKTEKTTQPNKIQWSLLEQPLNQSLWEFYQRAIVLRKTQAALRTDNLEFFHENPDARILAYHRWHDAERVVVIANFSDQDFPQYQVPHLPAAGLWQDWFTQTEYSTKQPNLELELPAWSATVLIQGLSNIYKKHRSLAYLCLL